MYDTIKTLNTKELGEKMQEQIYKINQIETFVLQHVFECGQCFRWNKQPDESYTGVFENNVINVAVKNEQIVFKGICNGNIQDIVNEYFDLHRDYTKIQENLSKIDEPLKMSVQYGKGIRLLNQNLWETIISFIISANNNIPRIKGIIERLSKQYGNPIEWNNQIYYTFPTPEELSKASITDLRALGLGFRDQRVYETTKIILTKQVDLGKLKQEKGTKRIREILLTLPGVGPKVADCIMLFSTLKCLDVFPVDVWVRRVMNELYFKLPEENKLKREQIEKLAYEKYGNLAGIAQQYLFYWKREA